MVNRKYNLGALVTAIGSFSADCVINTLKKNNIYVAGCDIYPSEWHAESRSCNIVYKVPFATEEEKYINALLKICRCNNLRYVIPLTDLEIDVINRYRNNFDELGIYLCIQSENCLKIARDKFALSEKFCKDDHVCVPKYTMSDNLSVDFPIPAIVKPINGRSSEGLEKIYDRAHLDSYRGKDNYIIQELLSGNVFCVDYVRDTYGNDFSIPREELLRTKNGAGTTIHIVPNEKLINIVSYIGNLLDIIGCVNMEFVHNGNDFYLIDINPRFSAGVAFSNFVGYDMVMSHLNAFMGKTIVPAIHFDECLITKRYKEELLSISNLNIGSLANDIC
jgi:carbamoyl-phosphate synthase large subunit